MKSTEFISSTPIQTERSVRGDEIRVLTSCRAGKIIPVAYVPLLREDRVSHGSVRLSLRMAETVHPLMNAVNVTAFAHIIPFSAYPQFDGMDSFNRSYQQINEPLKESPIPFFGGYSTPPDGKVFPFFKTMGIHWKKNTWMNASLLEAYNLLVNWRRKARTQKLPERHIKDTSLAEAFWKNPNMWHIVPDFDAAMMDGEVPLSINLGSTATKAYVDGIGLAGTTHNRADDSMPARQAPGLQPITRGLPVGRQPGMSDDVHIRVSGNDPYDMRPDVFVALPDIFEELRTEGIMLSLANIELAKKTAAFAKLRGKYAGIDEDHLIDLLMEGIPVPDELLKRPILLDRKSTIFGYTERHATDGASLEKSVTTGQTELTLNFRTPAINTGGIILITLEIVPEQLFERQYDAFLGTAFPDTLPNFMRDYLDPEKVDVVQNQYVDVEHSNPTGTFGYAPLNHVWKRSITRVGGRYYRPLTSTFVEDRQRFWSVEQKDPALTTDFYLVPKDLPHTVFADSEADPFEVLALGNVQIVGNTVFGKALEEDRGDYDAVASQVDTSRIAQEKP